MEKVRGIRVDQETWDQWKEMAARESRSVSNWVKHHLPKMAPWGEPTYRQDVPKDMLLEKYMGTDRGVNS